MHQIDFSVPLSGSQLFDYHAYATARNLCYMFPLQFEVVAEPHSIHIFGELNDTWYESWCRAVFSLGETKIDFD